MLVDLAREGSVAPAGKKRFTAPGRLPDTMVVRVTGTNQDGEPIAKPKSGRGFSRKQLAEALAGKSITKRARAKLLRSINLLLEKAKQPAATMKDVFGEEKPKVGESKGPAKKTAA